MISTNFTPLPLGTNLLIIAVSAAVVWFSGLRLERAVESLSLRTGLGTAFGGILLLAFSTSLPEVATTISGAWIGSTALVTNNLLGGVMLQTALLVAADAFFVRGALTYFAPQFTLLVGGVSLVLLLGLALAVMAAGEAWTVGTAGLGTTLIFAVHLAQVYLTYRSKQAPRWQPVPGDVAAAHPPASAAAADRTPPQPPGRAWMTFGIFSGLIFVSGWLVMTSAEALSEQTRLGAGFVGATVVALATSLPEVSTTFAAVRRGHHELAISNIFGSNLWCVALLFVGDVFYRDGALLADPPRSALVAAAIGVVMTATYLWGLLERRNRTLGRMGVDSAVVLVLYAAGLVAMYRIR